MEWGGVLLSAYINCAKETMVVTTPRPKYHSNFVHLFLIMKEIEQNFNFFTTPNYTQVFRLWWLLLLALGNPLSAFSQYQRIPKFLFS